MDLQEAEWEDKDWIDMVQGWRGLVNAVMNLRVT